jgi:ATP-dependent DNA helicase RecQ
MIHIIDVLRASKAQRIMQFNHDKLSVYGIGEERSKSEWNAIGDRLFELDAIEIGEFRSIKIQALGFDILKKKVKVEIDEDKLKVKEKKSKKVYDNAPKDEVFERFRELRSQIATKTNVPAYIVFSDKTLVEFASSLPQTKEEVLCVNGVGEVKYERYGEEFLTLSQEIKNEI